MTSKKSLVSCIALLALAVLSIANVSAFGNISSVEVADIEDAVASQPIAVFAGETLSVKIFFKATSDAEDVRVKAWITGEKEFSAVTNRFNVIAGNTYPILLSVKVPSTLNEDDLSELLELVIVVENSNDGKADEEKIDLTLQRESYVVEVLDVDMDNQVKAGDILAIDVVLKNRGSHYAEDSFVTVKIPALEIADRAYFGDLAPVDEPLVNGDRLDEVDAAERRLFLRIPSDAPAGVYVVEVEASNDESITTVTRKLAVSESEGSITILAPVHSKSFNAGESADYSIVLANSGSKLAMYEFVVEAPTELNVELEEQLVIVPAGSSRTVKFNIGSDKSGAYNFAVNIHSGTELIQKESFTANVQGTQSTVVSNPTVLLTVVLAVIFVVLLVVLIVLLTRKPAKSEEYGESYY